MLSKLMKQYPCANLNRKDLCTFVSYWNIYMGGDRTSLMDSNSQECRK